MATEKYSSSIGAGLLALALLTGCREKSHSTSGTTPPPTPKSVVINTQTEPAAEPAPAPAPTTASTTAVIAEDQPLGGQGRPLTPDEVSLINYGVYMFSQEKGRFPITLDEAVATKYIARLPKLPVGETFKYDPKSGAVSVAKQ